MSPCPFPIDPQATGWRVNAAQKALEVWDDLEASTQQDSTYYLQAKNHLESAIKGINASQNAGWGNTVKEWWTGAARDGVWEAVHHARARSAYCLAEETFLARVPYYCELAEQAYSKVRAKRACNVLEEAVKNPGSRPEAREIASQLLNDYYTTSDRGHTTVRNFRNLVYLLSLMLLVVDLALWLSGVTTGSVVGLGALAGAVSGVFALLKKGPTGTYNVKLAQVLIKVVMGGATAILAVVIVSAFATPEGMTAEVIAIIFGFSQQLFTELVDNRAGELKKALEPTDDQSEWAIA